MNVKNKLKIKEFSLLCGVTVKTLRHYEKIGLLMPNEVDESSGYRYYQVEQMQTMGLIRRLKGLGFSLEEIEELMASGTVMPSEDSLQDKITDCQNQISTLQKRLSGLQSMKDSQHQLIDMEKFSIASLPEVIVASHRQMIKNYAEVGRMCYEVIGPEMARLGCRCPEPGYCFTVEHNEYRPENIDIEYCEQVEEMGTDSEIVQFKRLPAVPKAIVMKHVGPYEKFYDSFEEAFQYIEQQGLKVTGRPRTVYVDGIWNQNDPNKWLSLIQIPVE